MSWEEEDPGTREAIDRLLRRMGPDRFRMDGSPYPAGLEGLLEWSRDMEDRRGRIVRQEMLWNGLWLSTVWLGLNHRCVPGPPLIFETMAFDHLGGARSADLWCERWSTLEEAEQGHERVKRYVSSVLFTLSLWWDEIWKEVLDEGNR
jgi:hypothetical protein